jgi:cyanate permease
VVLDFAVQVAHVSNQHLLTTAHPERTSRVIGGYMVFYSLGSALGAATTTSVFTSHGWAASSVLGAGFATCALIVWATDARRRSRTSEAGLEAADAHRAKEDKQRSETEQVAPVADRSRVS